MGHAQKQIDARPLRNLVRLHAISIPEIAKRTGLSLSALYTWERTGKMPAYMEAVCQGIVSQITGRKNPQTDDARIQTYLVKIPPAERERAFKLLEAIGIKPKAVDEIE